MNNFLKTKQIMFTIQEQLQIIFIKQKNHPIKKDDQL